MSMESTAHKRLREVFSFWGKASQAYSDPEELVINVNACIQSIRNVTFALQSQKNNIPDFDSWYNPWQEAMSKDSIMIWCRDARNKIVKQSDLETKSIAVASLHNNFVLEPTLVLDVHPMDSLEVIGRSVKDRISEGPMNDGYLRIERRWIDAELEGVELLSALAHAFTVLVTLIHDLKERKGPRKLYPEYESHKKVIDPVVVFSLLNEFTPECMKVFEDYRIEWFSFPELRPMHTTFVPNEISAEAKEEAKNRYNETEIPNRLPDSFEERYEYYIKTAKHLLETDGYHMTVVFMFDRKNRIRMINTEFPSQAEKYLFSQKLAKEVERYGISEVYFIGEAWTYSMEDKLKYGSPEFIENKKEILGVSALSATGKFQNAAIPFRKENGKCIFGEKYEDTQLRNIFIPIAKVWAKSNKDIARKVLEAEASVIPSKRFLLELYEPLMNDPCLCGSGEKYKKCCAGKYGLEGMDKAIKCFKSKKYHDALVNCRLHLTWYILSHKAHTVPLGPRGGCDLADKWIDMDIDSLSSILSMLMSCYEKTRKGKQFLKTLHMLRTVVADNRWYNKIFYFKALWHLRNSDINMSYNELKNISDLNTTVDLDVLTLYLQVRSHKMPVDKRIEIADRIIASADNAGLILQYQTFKAMQLYNHGNASTAIDLLSCSIDDFKNNGLADSSDHHIIMMCDCFHHLGVLTGNPACFKEGAEVCKQLLGKIEIGSLDLFQAHFTMGNLKLAEGNGGDAKEHFETAYKLNRTEILKVFIARSCMQVCELSQAELLLLSIDQRRLDESEKLDFAFAIATLAIETKGQALLKKATAILSETATDGPVYSDIKQAYLVQIQGLLGL